jgi:hypothetical protein
MKPRTLRQIAQVRDQVAALRQAQHIQVCDCCARYLATLDIEPETACAPYFLRMIARRIVDLGLHGRRDDE